MSKNFTGPDKGTEYAHSYLLTQARNVQFSGQLCLDN